MLDDRIRYFKMSNFSEVDYVLKVFNVHFVYAVKLVDQKRVMCRVFQVEVY